MTTHNEEAERVASKFMVWVSEHPIFWSDFVTSVAGSKVGATRVRPRYLATLRSDLDSCMEMAFEIERNSALAGEPIAAGEAFQLLVSEIALRRTSATSDYFGEIALLRAGLARSYARDWLPGVLHLRLGKALADNRRPASAKQHLDLAMAVFDRQSDQDGIRETSDALKRFAEIEGEVTPRIDEAEKWMNGKYKRRLPSIIQGLMVVGHFQLAHALARESSQRGILEKALEPCLVGAMLSRAQGDLDGATDWLELARETGADESVINRAAEALAQGVIPFAEAVEEIGFSWLGAGLPGDLLASTQTVLETEDVAACSHLLCDPGIYFLPTSFPQLLEVVGSATTDPLVRRAQFNDAASWWSDLGDKVQESLTYVRRGEVERSMERPMSAANCTMIGLLGLEGARRRNRSTASRRVVLEEIVSNIHAAILDLADRSETPEAYGWDSPPSASYFAAILDAVRRDAISILVRQPDSSGSNLSQKLAEFAALENRNLFLAGGFSGGDGLSVAGSEGPLSSAEELEIAFGNTDFLKVMFPGQVEAPEPNGEHQLLIDCAWKADGTLGMFGVWIRPSGPRPYAVFWDDLGSRATRLIESLRSPLESGLTVPRVLTNAEATKEALVEISQCLPEELLNVLIGHEGESRLTIIPTGPLWGIPWAALPVGQAQLVDHASVRIAPSTSLASGGSVQGARNASNLVTASIDEDLLQDAMGAEIELLSLVGDRRDLDGLKASDHGEVTLIVCHGNPLPGLGQHVVEGQQTYSAADILVGPAIGDVVVMLACWASACLYDRSVEPIAFSTAALVRGAHSVIGPQWALPQQSLAPLALSLLKNPRLTSDPAAALREVQIEARERDPDPSTWATLSCFG